MEEYNTSEENILETKQQNNKTLSEKVESMIYDDYKNVDLNKIIFESAMNNKSIFYASFFSFCGYLLQDVIFPNTFAKFTTDLPGFVKNISLYNVMLVICPYLVAEFLFYMNNLILSRAFPSMELEIIKMTTDKTIESIKTTRHPINVNEFILNLKKIMESRGFYFLILSYIAPTVLLGCSLVYYFINANVKIGLLVLFVLIILTLVTINFEDICINASYENEKMINVFYDNIQDTMANLDIVIVSDSKDREINKINDEMTNVYTNYSKSELESSSSVYKLHMYSLIIGIVFCGIAIKMYMDNVIDAATLVSLSISSILFMQYYNSTIGKIKQTIHFIGKFKNLNSYFSDFKIDNNNDKTNLIISNGIIKFDNVGLYFGKKKIFDNLSFTIEGDRKVGIIGDIGSGKTSILKMILGLVPYTGKIFIDNQDISLCAPNSILNQIVYIPQHPKMFNKNIFYNISYGTEYTEKDITDYIHKNNFSDFFKIFPDGLNTIVGKEGNKLSGGQKQIIALIRSLIQNKKILLIDEPTSSLDKKTKKVILDLINKIKNKTVIIVTHDDLLNGMFDDIIVL